MYHVHLRDLLTNEDLDSHSAESLNNALDVALSWADDVGGIEGRDALEVEADHRAFAEGHSVKVSPYHEIQVWND